MTTVRGGEEMFLLVLLRCCVLYRLWFFLSHVSRSVSWRYHDEVTHESDSNYAIISLAVSVHPSVRMDQLGSHWTDFCEIYFNIFRKSMGED
jgi:hypothetical protein